MTEFLSQSDVMDASGMLNISFGLALIDTVNRLPSGVLGEDKNQRAWDAPLADFSFRPGACSQAIIE